MMDKMDFCYILESSLLAYDGVDEDSLVMAYGIPRSLASAGIRLCNYLNRKVATK